MNRQRVRRAGSWSAVASFALVVLAACGGGDAELELEDVTRVPEISDAAAQATSAAASGAAATPESGGEPAAAAQTVEVDSYDIYFEPNELTIPANADVRFVLPNLGVTAHNFSIDALDIDVDIAPGATEEVVVNAPAGTYEFYCNVPGHKAAGMFGTLTVAEGAGGAGATSGAVDAGATSGSADAGATPVAATPVAASPVTTAPAATPAAAAAEPVEIVALDIRFEPEDVTIPANTDVTVSIPNEGVTIHNFSIDALGIDVDIDPGATEEVVINAPAGEYEYYCNVPGHKAAGMLGTLIVAEGAGAAAAAEPETDATPFPAAATPADATPAATPAGTTASGSATETVEVISLDIAFEPKEVTIPADTDVTFSLPNEGVTLHNFSIDELGIDIDQDPGATEEVVVNAPAGTYEYYCNVPGHKAAGMVGTLTVE